MYDMCFSPQEKEEEEMDSKETRLTLMEEVLLLGLKEISQFCNRSSTLLLPFEQNQCTVFKANSVLSQVKMYLPARYLCVLTINAPVL